MDEGLIYTVAVLFRLFLYLLTPAFSFLSTRPELVSRITSILQLKEAITLSHYNYNAYELPCSPPPLLVQLFSLFPVALYPYLFIVTDLAVAHGLARLAKTYHVRYGRKISVPLVLLCYLFNPITWMTCLSQSSIVFSHLCIVYGLLCAMENRPVLSTVWIFLASYLSMYPIVLLLPVYFFTTPRSTTTPLRLLIPGLLCVALLLTHAYLVTGSWLAFPFSTYGCLLCLSDLSPNIGLYWYLFIEMFNDFRSLFLVALHCMTFFLSVPATLKFHTDPFFLSFLILALHSIYKSYVNLGDLVLPLSLVPFFSHLGIPGRQLFFNVNLFAYGLVLTPINYGWWIYQGAGNANFYYATTLVLSFAQILFVIQFVTAKIYHDFHTANLGLKDSPVYTVVHK